MKQFIFLIAFLSSLAVFAQETTTTIQRTSDTTFVQVNVTTHPDGRRVTEEIPYNLQQFANLVADQNIENLIQIEQRARLNAERQRDVNSLKNYLVDSLSINYDSLLSEKLFIALTGKWKFIEKGGSETQKNTTVARHGSNPGLLRMTNDGGPGGWNLKNVSTHTWEIRNYDVNGTPEVVPMTLTQFNNFTGYRGKASNGTILILRR